MPAQSERFELRLDPEFLGRIDSWRTEQPDVPSRSESVRRLVDAGLGSQQHLQLYEMARFNVLSAACAKAVGTAISDAYVYAWYAGVYPFDTEAPGLHQPFADQFDVPEHHAQELGKMLDDRWLNKSVPSFYQLESECGGRGRREFWHRTRLIRCCRYMYLEDMFDDAFWKALLSRGDHPIEAQSIIRTFDRSRVCIA